MTRVSLFTVIFLISLPSLAADYVVGGGLSIGQLSLKQSGQSSTFDSYSSQGDFGALFSFNNDFGLALIGEYGSQQARNNTATPNYIEDSSNTFWSAQAGLTIHQTTFGAGVRNYAMKVKSYSSTTSYLENDYSGSIPVYFVSYAIPTSTLDGAHVRTVVQLSDAVGNIQALAINDFSVSLSLQILLGDR